MPPPRRKQTNIPKSKPKHPMRISQAELHQVIREMIERSKQLSVLPIVERPTEQPKIKPKPAAENHPEPKVTPSNELKKPVRSPAWLRKQAFKKNFRRGRI